MQNSGNLRDVVRGKGKGGGLGGGVEGGDRKGGGGGLDLPLSTFHSCRKFKFLQNFSLAIPPRPPFLNKEIK
jgi:hypothetical protein